LAKSREDEKNNAIEKNWETYKSISYHLL